MKDIKQVTTTFARYFKLAKDLYPKIKEKQDYMTNVSYALMIGD